MGKGKISDKQNEILEYIHSPREMRDERARKM